MSSFKNSFCIGFLLESEEDFSRLQNHFKKVGNKFGDQFFVVNKPTKGFIELEDDVSNEENSLNGFNMDWSFSSLRTESKETSQEFIQIASRKTSEEVPFEVISQRSDTN